MSDAVTRLPDLSTRYASVSRTNWGAIWGGVFTFAAIWTVFEALALAIFPSITSAPFEIWTVVLTIIAMYVAGLETGRLGGVTTRHDGLVHGIMMFGLSVVSIIVVDLLASGAMAGTMAARTGYTYNLSGGTEWAVFGSLFLGWLAAMGGASSGVSRHAGEVRRPAEPVQMRPAA